MSLWREGDAEARPYGTDWRGSVEHVHSRRRLYFTDLIELVTFLVGYTHTGEAEPAIVGRNDALRTRED